MEKTWKKLYPATNFLFLAVVMSCNVPSDQGAENPTLLLLPDSWFATSTSFSLFAAAAVPATSLPIVVSAVLRFVFSSF